LIQAHLQAPQRDTSISPTGNVRPAVGHFKPPSADHITQSFVEGLHRPFLAVTKLT